jgi:5-methylcytosine-specific restriction enzyme subunit McrC
MNGSDIEQVNVSERSLQPVQVPFLTEELWTIRNEFKGKIEVMPTFDGKHLIKTYEYVGVIVLPRHIIKIKPKISNANFMYMIMYALGLPEINPERFLALENKDFYHILILFFLHEIGTLLQRGLYGSFNSKSDNVAYIRGKILFKEHLLHNQCRNDKIYCGFSELTLDNIENRIIKFTLFYLTQYILLDNDTNSEIGQYYRKFDKISLLKSISSGIFGSVIYTVLNDHYKVILILSELILRDSSFDMERNGEKTSLSFLINMERLFQDFIANLLEEKLGEPSVIKQKLGHLDLHEKELEIRLDIQLSYNKKVAAILETKYKMIDESAQSEHITRPPSENIYQTLSYSVGTSIKKCILVYASDRKIEIKKYSLKEDIDLFVLRCNLACFSKEEFNSMCLDFVSQITTILIH